MICPRCNNEIELKRKSCPHCGASFEVIVNDKRRPSGQPKLGYSIAGSILSTLGLLFFLVPVLGIILTVLGIVFSVIGLKGGISARKNNGPLSLGTIITGAVGLGFGVLAAIYNLLALSIYGTWASVV